MESTNRIQDLNPHSSGTKELNYVTITTTIGFEVKITNLVVSNLES